MLRKLAFVVNTGGHSNRALNERPQVSSVAGDSQINLS